MVKNRVTKEIGEEEYLEFLKDKYIAKEYTIPALVLMVNRTEGAVRGWAVTGRKSPKGTVYLGINEDEAGRQYVLNSEIIKFLFDLKYGDGALMKYQEERKEQ